MSALPIAGGFAGGVAAAIAALAIFIARATRPTDLDTAPAAPADPAAVAKGLRTFADDLDAGLPYALSRLDPMDGEIPSWWQWASYPDQRAELNASAES
ncbi:hypothetical protein [Streptomyces sp. UH6]|uniref:hypothetical protein n=1 Tax=Streptomyces sp. UH6 TaxID=2748379 RepID=UPI0015D47918|nr:hypothetical protein [Streptomyces sp. UH6]NYV73143.1 hypothetical protein [Streptomyces sp. UH6]